MDFATLAGTGDIPSTRSAYRRNGYNLSPGKNFFLLADGDSALTNLNRCPNGITVSFYYMMWYGNFFEESVLLSNGGHFENTVGYTVRYMNAGRDIFEVLVQTEDEYWFVHFRESTGWLNIHFTWSATTTLTVHVNSVHLTPVMHGYLNETGIDRTGPIHTMNKLYFGGWPSVPELTGYGIVDEVIIWDEVVDFNEEGLYYHPCIIMRLFVFYPKEAGS